MSGTSSAGSVKVLALFILFVVIFILVFGLGVFVGKESGKKEIRIAKKFEQTASPKPEFPVEEDMGEMSEEFTVEKEPTSEDGEENVEEEEIVEEDVTAEEVTAEAPPTDAPPAAEPAKPAEETSPTPVKTEAPASTERVSEERLAEITQEIERKVKSERAEEKSPAKKVTLPPVTPGGSYTVQIGSFQNQAEANKLASAMQSRGYPVFIKSMTTPNNKNWYRVRIGTFKDPESAKQYGEGLKALEPDVKMVFITVNK
jgi:cell division septation protein DedD